MLIENTGIGPRSILLKYVDYRIGLLITFLPIPFLYKGILTRKIIVDNAGHKYILKGMQCRLEQE